VHEERVRLGKWLGLMKNVVDSSLQLEKEIALSRGPRSD